MSRWTAENVYGTAKQGLRARTASVASQRARRRRHEQLFALAGVVGEDRILDIGCGRLGLRRHEPELDITGVDILERFAAPFDALAAEGYLQPQAVDSVSLTREGLLRVDWLLKRFFKPEHAGNNPNAFSARILAENVLVPNGGLIVAIRVDVDCLCHSSPRRPSGPKYHGP